jgi:branched-chain amino acid transport system ATP-binding protein
MVTSAPAGLAPAGDRPPVLRLAGVSRRFGGMVAVGGVDLELAPGERLGVIGPNGAGKTTLFRLIAGELRPNDGRIELLGQDVTRTPAWRRARMGLSRTFQVANLFGRLSVGDNMRLAIAGRGPAARRPLRRSQPDTAMDETVADTLARVGLHGRTTDLVASLSHGEQRQLEIAMAIAAEPRVLLLDEPAAGLSAGEREMLRGLIEGLPRTLPLILIEHDMALVFGLADRVMCLHQGRSVAVGTPDSIRTDERVRAVYLGRAADA